MANKILVTPRSVTTAGHPALDALRDAGYEVVSSTPGKLPSEKELIERLPGCVGYLAGVEKITADVLLSATDLRLISRNGVGVDNIDAKAAQRQGIRICPALGANARGVAELTLGLALALARSIPFSDRAIKQGDWKRRKGIELADKTFGLIGCGRIGRLVAEMMLAVGMEVIAFDLYPDASFCPSERFRFVPLDELISRSDMISLHCPPPSDGRPMLDRDVFRQMNPGVYLINTARHDLIDTVALAEQLDTGHLAGAALDVHEVEPPTDLILIENDRVIATPHIGGFTHQSVDRAVEGAVAHLLEGLG